jgi:HSP20 family protein
MKASASAERTRDERGGGKVRNGVSLSPNRSVDDLFNRFFAPLGAESGARWGTGGFEVPTDIFHDDAKMVIRMDLPGVRPDDVEVTVQENVLLINGKRTFPYGAEEVRFLRRGTFYGDFTQRVHLGKGVDLERISARYDNGVLELTLPYAEEVQPKKVSIEVGDQAALSG